MKIDVFFIPSFTETDEMFNNSIVIMIDVLRSGTSLVAALYNGAKELIPVESLDKAIHIYSNLSKEIRFLGGERNGIKPNGFNAGNSPTEYTQDAVQGKTVVMTTTNGSRIYQKAKYAKYRIAGCFANLSAVEEFVRKKVTEDEQNKYNISILCAGNNGNFSMEDSLCAGAFVSYFYNNLKIEHLTDSARFAMEFYDIHSGNLIEYIKNSEHSKFLYEIGLGADVELSLTCNLFPIVPVSYGTSIKKQQE